MISTKINAEITAYHEKLFMGLSIRQLVCFAVAGTLAIATGFVGGVGLGIGMDILSYVIMIEVLPFLGLGFIRRNGYPFEKLIALYWAWYNENPKIPVRPYKECYHERKKSKRAEAECQAAITISKAAAKSRKKSARKSVAAAKKETRAIERRRRKKCKAAARTAKGSRLPRI